MFQDCCNQLQRADGGPQTSGLSMSFIPFAHWDTPAHPSSQTCGLCGAAGGAVASYFEAADYDVEVAVALDLALEAVEEVAFEFHDFSAAQAGHVDVVALWPALVVMLFALHVHEVELVDQPVALEQVDGAIDGDFIDLGIQFAGFAQDLAGVEVLLGRFHDGEDGAALAGHAQAAGHEFGLQAPGLLGFG